MSSSRSFSVFVSILGMLGALALVPAVSSAQPISALEKCTEPTRVEVKSDGKIVVLGTSGDCSNYRANFIAQLNADGTVDEGFADGGLLYFPGDNHGEVTGFEITSDGSFVMAAGGRLFKVEADGSLATDFGLEPLPPFPPQGVGAQSMDMDSAGRFIVQGGTGVVPQALGRYTADGNLDTTFGVNGVAEVDRGSDVMDVTPNGDIYTGLIDHENKVASVTKYGPSGTLDSTYGPEDTGTTTIPDNSGLTDPGLKFKWFSVDPTGKARVSLQATSCYFCQGTGLPPVYPPYSKVRGVAGILSPDGDYTGSSDWLNPEVAYDSSGASIAVAPRDSSEFITTGIFTEYDEGAQVPSQGMVNLWIGTDRPYATDAAFASGKDTITVGTAFSTPGACLTGACSTSLVVAKSDMTLPRTPASLITGGLVENFGTDRGVTALPAIECKYGQSPAPGQVAVGRQFCRGKLDPFPVKARVLGGRTGKPAVTLAAKKLPLDRGLWAQNPRLRSMSGVATVTLPPGVRFRKGDVAKRISIEAPGDDKNDRITVKGRTVRAKFDFEAPFRYKIPERSLKIKIGRGALKPLTGGQLRKRLALTTTLRYIRNDYPEQSRTVVAKAPRVKRSR